MVKNLWILNNGQLDIEKSILVNGRDCGKIVRVPVYSLLLETEQGFVVIDTGLNTDGIENPGEIWGERARTIPPVLVPEDDIRFRLKEIGVEAKDVRYVINTHLHWDHTGGNRFFEKAVFLVQKAEYRFALWPDHDMRLSYMRNHFDVGVDYQLLEGDHELMPGIRIIMTPGHTPGHQSVFITMAEGRKIIAAGDAVYTWENINEVIPPGNCWNSREAISSLHKIRTIQQLTGAIVLPSHDPNFWKKFDGKAVIRKEIGGENK